MNSDLQTILDEYPLYLRWSQLLELYRRLGLGSKWIVRQRIAAGEIERVIVCGTRAHYTRSSVERSLGLP